MLMLEDDYELDFLVYSASGSLEEESITENTELHKIVKRLMFKKFENFIEENGRPNSQ